MSTAQEVIRARLLSEIQTLNAERNSIIRFASIYMMIFSVVIVALSMRQLSKQKPKDKRVESLDKYKEEISLPESPKSDYSYHLIDQLRCNSIDSKASTECHSRTSSNESSHKVHASPVEKRAPHVSNISPSSSFKNSKAIKSGSGSRFYANVVTRRRGH
eukprot:767677-Hanusia_phi.AAC.5